MSSRLGPREGDLCLYCQGSGFAASGDPRTECGWCEGGVVTAEGAEAFAQSFTRMQGRLRARRAAVERGRE